MPEQRTLYGRTSCIGLKPPISTADCSAWLYIATGQRLVSICVNFYPN